MERVVRLEEQFKHVAQTLDRMDRKLDKLDDMRVEIGAVKAEMRRMPSTWSMVGWFFAANAALFGAAVLLARFSIAF